MVGWMVAITNPRRLFFPLGISRHVRGAESERENGARIFLRVKMGEFFAEILFIYGKDMIQAGENAPADR